ALAEREFADRRQTFPVELCGFGAGALAAEHDHVGTSDGTEFAAGLGDPGNGEAVVEAEGELHAEGNFAARAANEPDDIRVLSARRHEVGEADLAGCGGEGGLQDHCAGAIAAVNGCDFVAGPETPVTVVSSAEQGGEAGWRSKGGPAEPVDGAVATDQCRRFEVADNGVVLDARAVERFTFVLSKPLGQDASVSLRCAGLCEPLLTCGCFLLLMRLDAERTRRQLPAS